jgi:hopanoid biosynthesis associated protein HpnK
MIINGDDFGYSEAVNRAIIQAHTEGVLNSTSLMINERAAGEAIQLAKAHPDLAVGLHLVLVLGRSALPHAEIPHLTNARGEFKNSPFRAGLAYYFSSTVQREMRREMRAQFERFALTGLRFAHVDGHTHLHMHPVIFDELIELCQEFGVKRIRIVKGEMRVCLKLDRRGLLSKLGLGIVFNLLGRSCERKLARRDFANAEKVYGLLQTGNVNEDYLLGLLELLESGNIEVYCHPLALDADEKEKRENPGGTRELQALISPRVRQAVFRRAFTAEAQRTERQRRG